MFRVYNFKSLYISRIQYEFALYFTNKLWIYYLFHGFTMNLLSFARINYDCTIFWRIQWIFYEYTVFIANLIRIIRVFRDITSYSLWNYNFLREFTLNSLSILRIHYLWRDFTINSFGVSRIHYESTINFTNMICVLYTHEYIKNALSSTLSHYHFASLLWIHYFSREFIINSVSVPRIHYLSR